MWDTNNGQNLPGTYFVLAAAHYYALSFGSQKADVFWNTVYTEYGNYIHTHPFNGPLSRTTRVSQYQKGKTNLDFTEARVAVASAGPYASLHLAPDR